MSRFFGTPVDVQVGQIFANRRELCDAYVHRPLQAGISGTGRDGTDSIVVSGGYSDDEDHGDYIIYTGHGGRDSNSGRQISAQNLDSPGNAGLITSMIQGLPVRVTRGPHRESPYAPLSGYQYAGLYTVAEWKSKLGIDGYTVILFRLDRIPEQVAFAIDPSAESDPAYATSTVTRRIRDTAISRALKTLYNDKCQICSTQIPGIGGRTYSEGAHIKPLGRPHIGADAISNLLCLCPNHHSQLDMGGLAILDDFAVAVHPDATPFGELHFARHHKIELSNVAYHRIHWFSEDTFYVRPQSVSRSLAEQSRAAVT